ncbi:MAG: zinc dependent phospholipase C family protein [Clostridia bacterium]|nr:zinc dependent phospholipase C family protein [Clostridia bacterium]
MRITSHVKVASFLLDRIDTSDDLKVNKYVFKIGAIIPDVSPVYRFMTHHFKNKHKKVEKLKNKIEKTNSSISLAYSLGKMTHFIADSFCYVHNIKLVENAFLHKKYEKKLSKQLKTSLKNGGSSPNCSYYYNGRLSSFLTYFSEEYLKQHNPDILSNDNFNNDLSYILQINFAVIQGMIRQFEERAAVLQPIFTETYA